MEKILDCLTRGLDLGTQPSWHQIAFALPLAFLAYTGLETVANLAEQARQVAGTPQSERLPAGAVDHAVVTGDHAEHGDQAEAVRHQG